MARKRELKVEISGDSTGAQKALGDVDEKAGKSQGRLGQLGDKVNGFFDRVGLGGSKSSAAIGGVSDALGGSVGAAGAAAAAVGALGAVVANGIGDFVDLADEVRNFKQLSGATAEESSRFVAVMDDLGVSSESGANAMFKLGRNVGPNAEALQAMGVQIAKNADGTVNLTETTLNVADAFTRTRDPAKRAELVMQAFGKSGADLVPILEMGRKGLDDFFEGADNNFQLLSDEDLAKAREYQLAMDALGDATSGLSREIGSSAAPAVSDFANAIANLITVADNALGSVGGLGTVFEGVAEGALAVLGPVGAFVQGKSALDDFKGATDDTAEAADKLTTSNEDLGEATSEAADAQRDAAQAAKEQERALNDLLSAQAGAIDADIRLENATRKVEQAKQDAAESFEKAAAAAGKDQQANSDNETAVQNLKQAIVDQAQAVANKAAVDSEAAGVTLDAAEKNRILRDRLLEVAATLAPGNALRTELEGYATGLQSLPAAKQTVVSVSTEGLPGVEAQIAALAARGIDIPVNLKIQADILQMDIERSARNITTTRAFQDSVTNAVQQYLSRGGRFV